MLKVQIDKAVFLLDYKPAIFWVSRVIINFVFMIACLSSLMRT